MKMKRFLLGVAMAVAVSFTLPAVADLSTPQPVTEQY